MSEFTDEIVDASVPQGQGLKYLAHWPPVNIGFEDIIYTVENGLAESEFISGLNLKKNPQSKRRLSSRHL